MICGSDLLCQLEALHEDAYVWVLSCCGGNADRACDVLQDAYVKVATGRAVFAGQSSLRTWWFGVLRLTSLEQLRRMGRVRVLMEQFTEWAAALGWPGNEDADKPLTQGPDPSRLMEAMERLPTRQREVLHLMFQQQLSLSEAARVMGVSVGSARQHYDRAKKGLRSLLLRAREESPIEHARR